MSMRLDHALSKGEIRAFGGRLLDDLRHETERELAGIKVEPDGSFDLGCWVEQTSVARDNTAKVQPPRP